MSGKKLGQSDVQEQAGWMAEQRPALTGRHSLRARLEAVAAISEFPEIEEKKVER